MNGIDLFVGTGILRTIPIVILDLLAFINFLFANVVRCITIKNVCITYMELLNV